MTEGGADGDLKGDLFVWRPLCVAAEFGEFLEDFRARCAGIARAEVDARVERRPGDGFVAVEKKSLLVHGSVPFGTMRSKMQFLLLYHEHEPGMPRS